MYASDGAGVRAKYVCAAGADNSTGPSEEEAATPRLERERKPCDERRVAPRAASRGPALVCGRRGVFVFVPEVWTSKDMAEEEVGSVGLGGGEGRRFPSRERARATASWYFTLARRRSDSFAAMMFSSCSSNSKDSREPLG